MSERIFVYGTLRYGANNHYIIEKAADYVGKAVLEGWTKESVWRVYEGIVRKADSQVEGEVYEIPENLLHHLDIFEGEAYRRQRVLADISDGTRQPVWAWVKTCNCLLGGEL